MNFTITIGWASIPTIITLAAFTWALQDKYYRGSYNFSSLFTLPAAATISLAAWLVYFIIF